jgi:hypothetical protein
VPGEAPVGFGPIAARARPFAAALARSSASSAARSSPHWISASAWLRCTAAVGFRYCASWRAAAAGSALTCVVRNPAAGSNGSGYGRARAAAAAAAGAGRRSSGRAEPVASARADPVIHHRGSGIAHQPLSTSAAARANSEEGVGWETLVRLAVNSPSTPLSWSAMAAAEAKRRCGS